MDEILSQLQILSRVWIFFPFISNHATIAASRLKSSIKWFENFSVAGTLLTIVVPSDLQAGTYDFQVSLTDGKTSASATGIISIDTRRWKTHQ